MTGALLGGAVTKLGIQACRAALTAPALRSASQQNNYLCSPEGTQWYGADGGLSPLGSKCGNIHTNWNYQVPNNYDDVDFGAGRPDRCAVSRARACCLIVSREDVPQRSSRLAARSQVDYSILPSPPRKQSLNK